MSTVHCDEAEPHVFAALHRVSGCISSHAYLLFFCACAVAQFNRRMQDNNSNVLRMWNCCRLFIVISAFPARFGRYDLVRCSAGDSVRARSTTRASRPGSVPFDDVNELPRILIELPLQLALLIDDQLRGREENTVALVLILVV